ncbi:Hpt domain-containing protein [Polaribacter sp. R77954]|uniref:Hpt domain-containing protein n=1 Tax=Polaribacter sp. R77954 TaxID=3093870 RepID=UPI0037C5E6C6
MEQPNLSVIKEIAENDIDFQNSILDILKSEFPKEVEAYKNSFDNKNFLESVNIVHKLKHKISLLGLQEGVQLATALETDLKQGNTKLHLKFLEVLDKIHVYLY